MRRAGLDYHEYAKVCKHADWDHFLKTEKPASERLFALTTHATQSVYSMAFLPGDWLIFGAETRGLPPTIRQSLPSKQHIKLPMHPGQRSLNLSNAVAITTYEAWRQNGFLLAP